MTRYFLLIFFLFANVFGQASTPKGWWKFDDPAALVRAEAGYGSNLQTVGTSIFAVAGPDSSNGAVRVGIGSYFKMFHGMASNGGGSFVNEYTLRIDFKIAALGSWHAFFQTNTANANDGDCFINPTGNIGVAATGYSSLAIRPGEWYRLVVSVKNGSFYNLYLDGQLLLAGSVQSTDGRFAIENPLLLFADENGEDGSIDCAELAIWDIPLAAPEVKQIGGFGHTVQYNLMTRIPYLQTPTPTSIYVCWHDTAAAPSSVEYGTSDALGMTTTATSELLSAPYRWHSARLSNLQPDTEYFYRVCSGGGFSPLYSFRSLPAPGYQGKLRMLLLSDTHSGDSTWVNRVMRAAKAKTGQLYGSDLHNHVNLVLHSGDLVVSGGVIAQYTDQFFRPMSEFSPQVPVMTTIGNHEGESPYYYSYMKYDELSAFPPSSVYAEKMWSLRAGTALFIALNTNIVASAGTLQKQLLEILLKQAEQDSTIDFVFIMFHHLPYSELWVEGTTNDAASNYIRNSLFPVLKKYAKVQQLTYGHTHGFERGTIESSVPDGDFRIVCAGGGGGSTDNWGEFQNKDYPWIHKTFDHYFFQILEIDVQNRCYEISMYSIGNEYKSRDAECLDRWYRKRLQPGPDVPISHPPEIQDGSVVLHSSPISGPDSLMTVRIQIATTADFSSLKIDTLVHWQNIYGVNSDYEPTDTNEGLDLTQMRLALSRFQSEQVYYYRVKYRDHNLRWSGWSNQTAFTTTTGIDQDKAAPATFELGQNYPNPFNHSTMIPYQIAKTAHVSLNIYNVLGQRVVTLVDAKKGAGKHQVSLDAQSLSSGLYFYELNSEAFKAKKQLSLVK